MVYYIIIGNHHNYELLTHLPFKTENQAFVYCDKHGIPTTPTTPIIHYRHDSLPIDNNGVIFIAICNHTYIESKNNDIAVTKTEKIKSYLCSYFDDNSHTWIRIKTPILSRTKIFAETQLKVSPIEYQLFSDEFNRHWDKDTKWKVKPNGAGFLLSHTFPFNGNQNQCAFTFSNQFSKNESTLMMLDTANTSLLLNSRCYSIDIDKGEL